MCMIFAIKYIKILCLKEEKSGSIQEKESNGKVGMAAILIRFGY